MLKLQLDEGMIVTTTWISIGTSRSTWHIRCTLAGRMVQAWDGQQWRRASSWWRCEAFLFSASARGFPARARKHPAPARQGTSHWSHWKITGEKVRSARSWRNLSQEFPVFTLDGVWRNLREGSWVNLVAATQGQVQKIFQLCEDGETISHQESAVTATEEPRAHFNVCF